MSSACSKSDTSTASPSPTITPIPMPTMSATASPVATMSPAPTGSPFADVQLRLRELNKRLDDVFARTFRDLGPDFGGTGFASSVDLREHKNEYVARVYLPDGDTSKVDAKIDNGNLHLTMHTTETKDGATTSEKYDQIINLPQQVRADQMTVERKPNMVVVTIPKSTSARAVASSQPNAAVNPAGSPATDSVVADWDQRMIDDMDRMHTQMNEIFRNAFPNDILNGSSLLRLGSSVNVDNEKDKYVVHFTLPHRDLTKVNVDFQDGELRLSAQEQKKSENDSAPNTMQSFERSRYEEAITLPGPVKQDEMKVDRQANAVVVTLPKA